MIVVAGITATATVTVTATAMVMVMVMVFPRRPGVPANGAGCCWRPH